MAITHDADLDARWTTGGGQTRHRARPADHRCASLEIRRGDRLRGARSQQPGPAVIPGGQGSLQAARRIRRGRPWPTTSIAVACAGPGFRWRRENVAEVDTLLARRLPATYRALMGQLIGAGDPARGRYVRARGYGGRFRLSSPPANQLVARGPSVPRRRGRAIRCPSPSLIAVYLTRRGMPKIEPLRNSMGCYGLDSQEFKVCR